MSYGVGLACGPLYDLKLSQVLDFGYNAFSRSCMNFGACTFKATKKCGPYAKGAFDLVRPGQHSFLLINQELTDDG